MECAGGVRELVDFRIESKLRPLLMLNTLSRLLRIRRVGPRLDIGADKFDPLRSRVPEARGATATRPPRGRRGSRLCFILFRDVN